MVIGEINLPYFPPIMRTLVIKYFYSFTNILCVLNKTTAARFDAMQLCKGEFKNNTFRYIHDGCIMYNLYLYKLSPFKI